MDTEISDLLGESPCERMLKLPEVIRRMGVSRPTIYRMIKQGKFPRPAHFGGSSLWPESEVAAQQRLIMQARDDH